jgi:hypothetical protein
MYIVHMQHEWYSVWLLCTYVRSGNEEKATCSLVARTFSYAKLYGSKRLYTYKFCMYIAFHVDVDDDDVMMYILCIYVYIKS